MFVDKFFEKQHLANVSNWAARAVRATFTQNKENENRSLYTYDTFIKGHNDITKNTY